MCVCVRVCACVCVCACVRACVCACVCMCDVCGHGVLLPIINCGYLCGFHCIHCTVLYGLMVVSFGSDT